jgi:hypothetical protein
MPTTKTKTDLTKEELDNIVALGEVLRTINKRLLKEGKIEIVNDKIVWDKALLPCKNGTCEHIRKVKGKLYPCQVISRYNHSRSLYSQ